VLSGRVCVLSGSVVCFLVVLGVVIMSVFCQVVLCVVR